MRPVRGQDSGQSPGEAAAAWFVRRDSAGPAEDPEFEAWLAESPRNRANFDDAGVVWGVFEGSEADPHVRSLRAAALQDSPRWWSRQGLAIAASLALALTAGLGLQLLPRTAEQAPATPTAAPAVTYQTARGQRLEFSLSDGTAVHLDTDSLVAVSYTAAQRLVRLEKGQAFFEVAKNKARPFVVLAGLKRVTALGTAFDVRIDPSQFKVLLVEGKVAVESRPTGGQLRRPTKILAPGQQLTADANGDTIAAVDIDDAMLWREGLVEFDDVPLGSAVGEMNRYASRPMVVADARIANLRVSGIFKVAQADRFPKLVGEVLPVEATASPAGTEVLLTRSK